LLTSYATSIGLDGVRFEKELSSHMYLPLVNASMTEATLKNYTSTPSIEFNGKKMDDAFSFNILEAQIEKNLKR
jgi:hypothetical protein